MRCDEILGQGNRNIGKDVLNDFLHTSILTSLNNQGLIIVDTLIILESCMDEEIIFSH